MVAQKQVRKGSGNSGRRLVQTVDWVGVRRAYIERAERPRIDDLSVEFGVAPQRITAASAAEGWALLRAKRLEAELQKGDAALAILHAAKADGVITRQATELALRAMHRIGELVDSLENWKSLNTRANTLNTCTFALGNIAKALKDLGVVGLPKVLKDQADNGNGKWNPGMLAALNVTIQNVTGGKVDSGAAGAPPEPAEDTVEAETAAPAEPTAADVL